MKKVLGLILILGLLMCVVSLFKYRAGILDCGLLTTISLLLVLVGSAGLIWVYTLETDGGGDDDFWGPPGTYM